MALMQNISMHETYNHVHRKYIKPDSFKEKSLKGNRPTHIDLYTHTCLKKLF